MAEMEEIHKELKMLRKDINMIKEKLFDSLSEKDLQLLEKAKEEFKKGKTTPLSKLERGSDV